MIDHEMPDIDGVQTLNEIKKVNSSIPVIFLCADTKPRMIFEAVRCGACDYLTKPFDNEDLDAVLENVQRLKGSDHTPTWQESKGDTQPLGYFNFISQNSKINRIKEMIGLVANTDVTVLLQGESGVGKEVVARAIHHNSNRSGKPFVKVNCAALPEDLLESELFGYQQGAFTGAVRQKPGKFELANEGTIFLDEIGELNPLIQGKLLHVLQDGEYSPLGGKRDVKVDVRVIAATNKNLEKAIVDGTFREDLYYRLSVVNIFIPPLRERKEEVPIFCNHFIEKYSGKFGGKVTQIPPDLMSLFMQYNWRGNVRELENLIKRFLVLGDKEAIMAEIGMKIARDQNGNSHAPAVVPLIQTVEKPIVEKHAPGTPLKEVGKIAIQKVESEAILDALQRTNWNRKEAASFLSISYKALLYKIKDYQIQIEKQNRSKKGIPLKDIAKRALQEAESVAISEALQKTGWNKKRAAKLLSVSYKALRYKIQDYKIAKTARNDNPNPEAMQKAELASHTG